METLLNIKKMRMEREAWGKPIDSRRRGGAEEGFMFGRKKRRIASLELELYETQKACAVLIARNETLERERGRNRWGPRSTSALLPPAHNNGLGLAAETRTYNGSLSREKPREPDPS
jgi:hypothetical protein